MLLLWGAPHTLAAWSPHEPIRLSTKITTARRWQGGEKVKERAVQRLFSPSPLGSNTEEGTRKQWYVVPHEPLLPEAGRRGEIISSRLQCSSAFNMIGGGGDRSIGIAKCSRDLASFAADEGEDLLEDAGATGPSAPARAHKSEVIRANW